MHSSGRRHPSSSSSSSPSLIMHTQQRHNKAHIPSLPHSECFLQPCSSQTAHIPVFLLSPSGYTATSMYSMNHLPLTSSTVALQHLHWCRPPTKPGQQRGNGSKSHRLLLTAAVHCFGTDMPAPSNQRQYEPAGAMVQYGV